MSIETWLHARRAGAVAAGGLAVVLLLLLPAGRASAATTVGQDFVPTDGCGTSQTSLQIRSPGSSYTIPKPGVLTSWTIRAPAGSSLTAAFKVARQTSTGSDNFLL